MLAGSGDHLDRVHRALLEAHGAAGAAVVVELGSRARAQLDHRVLRAGAEAAVALEAVAAGQAAARLVGRLGSPSARRPPRRSLSTRCSGASSGCCRRVGVAEVPEVSLSKSPASCFGRLGSTAAAQPGIDVAGRLLAVADADRDGALARAPCRRRRRCPGGPVISVVDDLHGAVALNSTPGRARRKRGVAFLAERQDHRVGLERLEPPGGCGRPFSSSSISSTVSSGPSIAVIVRSQLIRTPSARRPRPPRIVRRHLRAVAPVDDERLVGAEPARDAGGVHRGVAAAVDRDAAPDQRRLARRRRCAGTTRRRASAPASRAGMSTRLERCAPTATKTASKRPSRLSAAGPRPGGRARSGRPAPRSGRSRRRARRAAGGRRGCRSASSRRARARVANLDLVAEPARGGRRRRGRSDRRRRPARACRCGPAAARTPSPARAPDRRGTARPRGSRRRCRARRGCRRSRTGGSRPGRGSPATGCRRPAHARPLVATRLRVRQPRLDVLAGRAAGVAGRQQVDVDGPTLAHRAGARVHVHEIRERRQVSLRAGHTATVPSRVSISRASGGPRGRARSRAIRNAERGRR